VLPERTEAAEDAFVAQYARDDADTDELIDAIEHAMSDRRPRLAARLVQLLGDHVEIEAGSDLERAQRAARLLLFDRETPEDRSWSALEDAWGAARRRRMHRIKDRMRQSMRGKQGRLNRLGKPRRR
jgi:hypothetical protein